MAISNSEAPREVSEQRDLPTLLSTLPEIALPVIANDVEQLVTDSEGNAQDSALSANADGHSVPKGVPSPNLTVPTRILTQGKHIPLESMCERISAALDACKLDIINIISDTKGGHNGSAQGSGNLLGRSNRLPSVTSNSKSLPAMASDEHQDDDSNMSSCTLLSDKEWLKSIRPLEGIQAQARLLRSKKCTPLQAARLRMQKNRCSMLQPQGNKCVQKTRASTIIPSETNSPESSFTMGNTFCKPACPDARNQSCAKLPIRPFKKRPLPAKPRSLSTQPEAQSLTSICQGFDGAKTESHKLQIPTPSSSGTWRSESPHHSSTSIRREVSPEAGAQDDRETPNRAIQKRKASLGRLRNSAHVALGRMRRTTMRIARHRQPRCSVMSAPAMLECASSHELYLSAYQDGRTRPSLMRQCTTRFDYKSKPGWMTEYFGDPKHVHMCCQVLGCLLIGFDIALMTYQCDVNVQSALVGAESPGGLRKHDAAGSLSLCNAVLFSLELFFCIVIERRKFFYGPARWWHVLDILTVISSWVDMSADANRAGISRFGRALRLLQVARLTQRQFPSFAKTALCVVQCSHVAVPILSVLMSGFYLIGLLVMSGVQTYANGPVADANVLEDMRNAYGSMGTTLLTLVEGFLELRSAGEWYGPVTEMHWVYRILFLSCWFFVMSVLTNVMTGEVTQAITRVKKPNAAELVIERAVQEQEHAENLYTVLSSLDADSNGTLSKQEFSAVSGDPFWQGYLQVIGINNSCAERVFDALNDNTGRVEVEDFTAALLHVTGTAKQFDLLDVKRLLGRCSHELQSSCRLPSPGKPSVCTNSSRSCGTQSCGSKSCATHSFNSWEVSRDS